MKDRKVLAILSAKPPRFYKKPDGSYHAAQERYRARYAAYRDAYCNAFCTVYKGKIARAFYGVEMCYVQL